MRIAIDIRKIYDSGIGSYIRSLLEEYALLDDGHSYLLLAAPADMARIGEQSWAAHPKFELVPLASRKYSLGELWQPARLANSLGAEVYHAPHFTLPLGLRMRAVVSVQDLTPLRFPQYFSAHKRAYARLVIDRACRNADVIITPSQFTKDDVCREFNVETDRVQVVHLGAGPNFVVLGAAPRAAFRAKYGLAGRYAFYAGNFKPHKNLGRLLQAMTLVPPNEIEQLVLVGGAQQELASAAPGAAEAVRALGDRLHVLGKIPIADLVAAYNEAHAVVLPSLYEGFGYPLLEAMACGAPVVCSGAASLPEVAGDAALFFDAADSNALAAQLRSLSNDESLRASLQERGFARLKSFSPRATALATLQAYVGDEVGEGIRII